ncbi:MAG: O-antigen ligase family protein [Candidatus Sumerlaeaceae bacterium]
MDSVTNFRHFSSTMIERFFGLRRQDISETLAILRGDLALALLALLLFWLPLLRVGQLEDSFLTPKIAFIAWLLVPIVLVALRRAWRRTAWLCTLPVHSIFFAAFVAWGGLSLLHAHSAALGLFALAYFSTLFALLLLTLVVVRHPRAGWTLLAVGITTAALTALWTLAEDFTKGNIFGRVVPRLPDWRGYLAAGLGNSGHIAGFVGMFVPAALLALLATPRFPIAVFFALGLMAASAIVTWSVGSSGATLITLVLCTVIVLQSPYHKLLRWRRLLGLISLFVALLLFYFLPIPGNPHVPSLLAEAFGSQRWVEGWPTRLVIWKTTWHMIVHQPWLGVGLGNFTLEYVRQIVPALLADPHLRIYAGAYTNEAHNEYLQVWAELGIIGFVLYLGIFVAFFARAHRLFHRQGTSLAGRFLVLASAAGVCVFLLDSLMSFPLRLPSHAGWLAVFLALPEAAAAQVHLQHEAALSARGRHFPSLGWLSITAAILLISSTMFARRMVAEFLFKQGRTLAEAPLPMPSGGFIVPWEAAETTFRRGIEELLHGQKDKAQQTLRAVSEILQRPPFPDVESYWRKALEWDPRYSNASSRYGAFLLMRGNFAEAQQMLRRALLDLEACEVHERLGFAHFFLGDITTAIREWDLCRQRRPLWADYYRELIRAAQK